MARPPVNGPALPYMGSGSLSGCDLRNLTGALGQQPVDGAQWHWRRSYNVPLVRQEKCIGSSHATLWQRNEAYWQPKSHRVTGRWCLQEHIPRASVQTLASWQLSLLFVVTWGSMLPKALPPFQVLGLALFSLRENCLRARMKLGEILQRTLEIASAVGTPNDVGSGRAASIRLCSQINSALVASTP